PPPPPPPPPPPTSESTTDQLPVSTSGIHLPLSTRPPLLSTIPSTESTLVTSRDTQMNMTMVAANTCQQTRSSLPTVPPQQQHPINSNFYRDRNHDLSLEFPTRMPYAVTNPRLSNWTGPTSVFTPGQTGPRAPINMRSRPWIPQQQLPPGVPPLKPRAMLVPPGSGPTPRSFAPTPQGHVHPGAGLSFGMRMPDRGSLNARPNNQPPFANYTHPASRPHPPPPGGFGIPHIPSNQNRMRGSWPNPSLGFNPGPMPSNRPPFTRIMRPAPSAMGFPPGRFMPRPPRQ
ncbi:hypothetical protein P879_01201, partial [Paragonimus westermani]